MAEIGIVCAQIVLSIFNVIQFLCGWLFIIVGAIIKVKGPKEQLGQDGTVIILIVIGSILVVVSLVGCFGAWTKNMCLLVTFCVFTSIGFILVVITLAMTFAGRSKANETLKAGMKEVITWNDTTIVDSLQKDIKCCGVDSYKDWNLNPKYRGTEYLPDSCCGTQEGECYFGNPSLHQQGCIIFVEAVVKYIFDLTGTITGVTAVVLFLAILSAAYMAHRVKSSYHPV